MNTLKLAWRNVWRNKRRTYITSASIFLAVMLSSLMVSIQKGAWDKMIDDIVNFYYGYAQIHSNGYWRKDKSLDNAFQITEEQKKLILDHKDVEHIVPRIESFALASAEQFTSGVLVIGTDPASENEMTALSEKIISGSYFGPEDQSALLAIGAAEKLKLEVGDTLVLITQGYHGVNAAGKFAVVGIVKFGSPELNKNMVYLPLKEAQHFFGAENLVTTLALDITNGDSAFGVVKDLRNSLSTELYEIMTWEEMMPELVEARVVDAAGSYIVLLILYIIIGFGILGTILMMTKEREYEFGVLTAIGMGRMKLFSGIYFEIIIMGLLGAFIGILISYPIVYYFYVNPLDFSNMEGMSEAYESFGFEPIFPAAIDGAIFVNQAIIIFFITSFLALYPFFKIMNLKPVEAMRE